MTAIKTMDRVLPFTLKQEPLGNEGNEENENVVLHELEDILSMPLPSLLQSSCHLPSTPNDEFLRLTEMVRTVYLTYLHKCLFNNYIICYKEKADETPTEQLKKCADQMELNAVRCSLEASRYRQSMLELISDIKSHTTQRKVYKKLVIFLETPLNKVDVAVQTSSSLLENSCCALHVNDTTVQKLSHAEQELLEHTDNTINISPTSTLIQPVDTTVLIATTSVKSTIDSEHEQSENIDERNVQEPSVQSSFDNMTFNDHNEEDSQDSLLQHMEDMFCDSDDSSDLTMLIEKHSTINKHSSDEYHAKTTIEQYSCVNNVAACNTTKTLTKDGRKSGRIINSGIETLNGWLDDRPHDRETNENKQKKRTNSIWFVERVHRVSKLKAKMTELSLTNYRKHGKVKEKFLKLFGECDEEDMMPDSPICIEEHLTACKERIAPWIVKYLMPFYKKRRIKDRQLFKALAKHIADSLILENTFPEENCVSRCIGDYFRNKKFVGTKQDIYV